MQPLHPEQHTLPSRDFLHECFVYQDGNLIWKERPPTHFKTKAAHLGTNKKSAGTSAINISNNYRVVLLGGKVYRAAKIIYKMFTGEEHTAITYADNDRSNTRIDNLEPHDQELFYRNSIKAVKRAEKLPFGIQAATTPKGTKYIPVVCFGGRGYRVGASYDLDTALEIQKLATDSVVKVLMDIRTKHTIYAQARVEDEE